VLPSVDRSNDTPLTNEPAFVEREPKPVRLAGNARQAALTTVRNFVATAVLRRHIDDSWQLVTPTLRAGYTRKEWRKGDIPVPVFPADSLGQAGAQVDYSYRNTVGLHVWLLPKRGAKIRATTFMAELKAFGSGARRYWLVDSFTPLGSSDSSPLPGLSRSTSSGRAPLSAFWLAAPLSILALVLLVPLAVGLREWRRGRRVRKSGDWSDELPELPPVRTGSR
jgi:hypothetical protein